MGTARGGFERIGRWTMAAYDNLLFIGASHQCFHQPPLCLRPHAAAGPNRAPSCQTRRHRRANAENTQKNHHKTHFLAAETQPLGFILTFFFLLL